MNKGCKCCNSIDTNKLGEKVYTYNISYYEVGNGETHCVPATFCPMCGRKLNEPDDINSNDNLITTNADYIKGMSNKELAVLFCYCTSEPSYDEGMDGEWQQIGYNDVWQSTVLTGYFDSYEDVYEAVLKWLNSNKKNEMLEPDICSTVGEAFSGSI